MQVKRAVRSRSQRVVRGRVELPTFRFSQALSDTWPSEAEPVPYLVGEFSQLGALTPQFSKMCQGVPESAGVFVGILWG